MKQRCLNPKSRSYNNYGGRGITICEQWRDYEKFANWAYSNGYKLERTKNGVNKWTIDRINNDGNYEPKNCRIVPMCIQNANKGKFTKGKYIGVYKQKHGGYEGRIQMKGVLIFRTYGKTELDAAKRRDKFILENNLPNRLNNVYCEV